MSHATFQLASQTVIRHGTLETVIESSMANTGILVTKVKLDTLCRSDFKYTNCHTIMIVLPHVVFHRIPIWFHITFGR